MTKSSAEKYTGSELRDPINEDIQVGDQGGKPGQWSARNVGFILFTYLMSEALIMVIMVGPNGRQ